MSHLEQLKWKIGSLEKFELASLPFVVIATLTGISIESAEVSRVDIAPRALASQTWDWRKNSLRRVQRPKATWHYNRCSGSWFAWEMLGCTVRTWSADCLRQSSNSIGDKSWWTVNGAEIYHILVNKSSTSATVNVQRATRPQNQWQQKKMLTKFIFPIIWLHRLRDRVKSSIRKHVKSDTETVFHCRERSGKGEKRALLKLYYFVAITSRFGCLKSSLVFKTLILNY